MNNEWTVLRTTQSSAQSAAVQAWLQAREDSTTCNYLYDEDDEDDDAW
jgi:hypothetical protein